MLCSCSVFVSSVNFALETLDRHSTCSVSFSLVHFEIYMPWLRHKHFMNKHEDRIDLFLSGSLHYCLREVWGWEVAVGGWE